LPVQEASSESEQPSPDAEKQEQENAADEEIIFSRIVRATVGQLVEIPFRGTGWVYLGELGAQRGIEYRSRRLDPEGQSFIFQVEAAGTYTLKFYKQDFIRNYILNDHVQVIAGQTPETGSGWFNPPLDRGRVIAEPRWPTSLEEAELARNGGRPSARETPADAPPPETVASRTPAEPAQPAPQSGESVPAQPAPPPAPAGGPAPRESAPTQPVQTPAPAAPTAGLGPATPPNIFLQRAQEEFDAGKVASAIAILDQFTGYYPSGSDEAYWLYGQFYEANSPSRNILTALDYYRRLTREYPQSSRYNDARRRIAYLERFYINIQ
jgi:TolA-binding protein